MEYVRLEKLVELKQGLAINSHTNYLVSDHETKLALLRIADMPSKRKVVFMDEDTPDRYIADEDDIIYTRTGQVGLVFTGQNGVVHNNCFRVIPIDEQTLSRKYLFWALSLPEVYYMANIYAAGAAQPDLPHSSFKKEEMAQRLYKEWFVRFRFPGNEKAEFENGLPKGWSLKNLFDVADVSYGYAFKSDLFCNDKILNAVVRIRDIQDNHTDTYTSEVCDDKYLIEENAILVGMDGLFHMCLWNGEKAYLNQRVVKICSKKKDMCNYMIFMAIRPQIKFWEQVIAGTTVAHLGDKHLKKIKIAIPTEDLLLKANESIQRIMVEKNQLFKQNQILSRQRDLLLPRLMSGKLEVKV